MECWKINKSKIISHESECQLGDDAFAKQCMWRSEHRSTGGCVHKEHETEDKETDLHRNETEFCGRRCDAEVSWSRPSYSGPRDVNTFSEYCVKFTARLERCSSSQSFREHSPSGYALQPSGLTYSGSKRTRPFRLEHVPQGWLILFFALLKCLPLLTG